MKHVIITIVCLYGFMAFGQETVSQVNDSIDYKYREDQFYFSATYNLLRNQPDAVSQNGFSSGFHLGFIRDMPINKKRTMAIGLGFGYSGTSINQNVRITENDQNVQQYEIVESGTFSKNRITLHQIEVPLEIRWRTSTPSSYRFWRIYTGLKVGYVFGSSARYEGDLANSKVKGLDNLNTIQYGITFTAGYDKFNAHIYYALTPIFDGGAKANVTDLDVSVIRIGLMLYIL